MADANDGCAVHAGMAQTRKDRDFPLQWAELEGQDLAHDIDATRLNSAQLDEHMGAIRCALRIWRMHGAGVGQKCAPRNGQPQLPIPCQCMRGVWHEMP